MEQAQTQVQEAKAEPRQEQAEAKAEAKEEKAKPARRRAARKAPSKSSKKAPDVFLSKSRRKAAVARARIMQGGGRITVNGTLIDVLHPEQIRRLMLEPVFVSASTRSLAKTSDISVTVSGGGMTAQGEAVRSAIAKAISGFSGNDIIRKEYLQHDRSMLVDDSRRVEPKKFLGTKARARFQTSYR